MKCMQAVEVAAQQQAGPPDVRGVECLRAGTCCTDLLYSANMLGRDLQLWWQFPVHAWHCSSGMRCFAMCPWTAAHICQQTHDAAGNHTRCRHANTNVPHHAIPASPSNDAHRQQSPLCLPLHHLLSDSSDSDAMAADFSICGGRISEVNWFLLLCQKLASMEARLQRPRLDVATSQICRLIRQMEHFLGDLHSCCSSCSVWQQSTWHVTYSCHDARHSQIYERSTATVCIHKSCQCRQKLFSTKACMPLTGIAFCVCRCSPTDPSCLSNAVKRSRQQVHPATLLVLLVHFCGRSSCQPCTCRASHL